MAVTALHAGSAFMVPRHGEPPDVGFWSGAVEPLEFEIDELAAQWCGTFPKNGVGLFPWLVSFALAIVALLRRRAKEDIDDGFISEPKPSEPAVEEPAPTHPPIIVVVEGEEKRFAARMGRFLDWTCKGRTLIEMGARVFVFASFIRASAVDGRTDQDAAWELGNDSRASINRIKSEFRRDLGADYPGATGKSKDTRRKCKKSRNKQLKN